MPFDGNPNVYEIDERTRILRDWVHELRYGGHVQICYMHRDNDRGYCAVGVLEHYVTGGNEFAAKWLDAKSVGNNRYWTITDMNDGVDTGSGANFSEIADYIESEWLS